jgi:hypothetical protein
MYLIVNTTEKIITISDIGLQMSAHSMMDLDKLNNLKMDYLKSNDLKQVLKMGNVRLMKTDHKVVEKSVLDKKPIQSQINQKELVDDIKSFLKDEIKAQLASVKPASSNLDTNAILNAIASISGSKENSQVEEIGLDEDKIADIHSKAMDRITKKTESNIIHEEKTVKDNNLSSNIDELEDLN